MTIKEVKEWLDRGRFIDGEINILLAERDRLFEQATKITKAPKIDNVTEGGGNAIERIMLKYTNCTTKIDMRVDELCRVKEEIEAVIDKVEDRKLRNLLRCRYINCMTWEDTAYALGLSYVHVVRRLHPKALCEAQKILEIAPPPKGGRAE